LCACVRVCVRVCVCVCVCVCVRACVSARALFFGSPTLSLRWRQKERVWERARLPAYRSVPRTSWFRNRMVQASFTVLNPAGPFLILFFSCVCARTHTRVLRVEWRGITLYVSPQATPQPPPRFLFSLALARAHTSTRTHTRKYPRHAHTRRSSPLARRHAQALVSTTRPSAPGTVTATELISCNVIPIPSWPALLLPQHMTPPPDTMAHVWTLPAAMAEAERTGPVGM
jgi:hypothetical protein